MTGGSGSFALISSPQTTAHVISHVAPVVGQSEVQRLAFSGTTAQLAGTFTITVDGQTTAPITFVTDPAAGTDARASFVPVANNIQAALDALLGVGNTFVVSSPEESRGITPVFTIQFTGALAGANIPQMTATNTSGGATASVTTPTDGAGNSVQSVIVGGTTGTITFSFNGVNGAALNKT